jgi:hypothetical protein
MSQLRDLQQMQRIVQVQYDQKRQEFQKLVVREGYLRAELHRISALGRETAGEDIALQSIGADILWRGWVGRAKTQINIELAQTLALKRYHQDEVRQAFGKLQVVEQLIEKLRNEAKKSMVEQALNTAIEQHLLHSQTTS